MLGKYFRRRKVGPKPVKPVRGLFASLICILALALGVTIAKAQPPRQDTTGRPDQPAQQTISVLAVVNGQQVTRQQLAQECIVRFGESVLEGMVNKQLVNNECQRLGITITAADVEKELQRRADKFGMSVDRYIALIQSQRNVTAEKLKNDIIWMELALRQLAAQQTVVTAEEVRQQLDSEFGPQVQVRAIALDSQQEAEEVLSLVQQSPEEFGRMAKERSKDATTASVRGLLPPIRRGVGHPLIEDTAFSLVEGQISGIIEVEGQFIIMKCERHFDGTDLAPQQRLLAEQRIEEQVRESKLGRAASDLFKRLQQTVKIVNVYNDPELRQKMPGVAATVDGAPITMRQVSEECISRFGHEVLESEINRTIITQQLQQHNLTVNEADIQGEIARAADSFGFTRPDGSVDMERWMAYVTKNEEANFEIYVRDEVWPSVAMKKLVQDKVQVTDEDLQKAFEANFGPRVECLAIVLQDQRTAQKIWQMAKANPTDQYFGELAHQYSVEPASRANYGQVPPIQKHGGRPLLEEEAFRLNAGEISGIVRVGEHWIILWCQGRTTPVVQDFDAVRDELYRDILEKKLRIAMAEEFERLLRTAQIDNFLAGTSQPGAETIEAVRQMSQPSGGAQLPFRENRN